MVERPLRDIVGELRVLLACPKISPLPWSYGECKIEGRISKEWPLDNKTLARAAVNALPRLLAAVEPELERIEAEERKKEDELIAQADAIKARRARAV